MKIKKRDGSFEDFDVEKIYKAVEGACENKLSDKTKEELSDWIYDRLSENPTVEEVQNHVEDYLMDKKWFKIAKRYILYRETHKQAREIRERLDYMNEYADNTDNAATSSETDPNANVTVKNAANLEGEVWKNKNRIVQRQRMKIKLREMYPEIAHKYIEDIEGHEIYIHDEAQTPVLKPYCMAVTLYPLMTEGVGNIDNVTPSAPNGLRSFSGQISNLIFLLSSQCKGAVAVAEYFIALNYYVIKEFGHHWYDKLENEYSLKKKTIRSSIEDAFSQFVWAINQPAGNRGYQSPFTNLSYFDHTYFEGMFEHFYYPNGEQPEWKAIDTLQRMFMKWFNAIRLKQVLTFPVETETFCMVHDGKDVIDQDYKKLCAEMYSEGHSFFTYLSDSVDSLASCCFSKYTKVLTKSSDGVDLVTFEELSKMKWQEHKRNFTIFHNGSWVRGKEVSLPNRPMYKIVTSNNKEIIVTDNHLNPTLRGDVKTSDLTVNDYLLFNSRVLDPVPEKNLHLTYEQGIIIGAYLGDGCINIATPDGIYREVMFSLNEEKYNTLKPLIDKGLDDLGLDKELIRGNTKDTEEKRNLVPTRICSSDLVQFISTWTEWTKGVHADSKKLNMDCLLQSVEFRKGILDGLLFITDGTGDRRIYTSSVRLKDCIEALLTSLGYTSNIIVSDKTDEKAIFFGKEYNRNFPVWFIRWNVSSNKRAIKDLFKVRNNSIFFKIKSIERIEDYKDKVYCFEMTNKDEPYFTLPNGLITHNCRLRNGLQENTFSPTSGMTGVMTGSCNVITLNISRIVQNCVKKEYLRKDFKNWSDSDYEILKDYLTTLLDRVYKYHITYKTMLYEQEEKKMYSACNAGYISMSKLYSTIGINGLNEGARFLGLEVSNNEDYLEFLQFILGTIKEQNTIHSIHDKKRPFIFNSEVVPAEGLGSKNYNWDKKDGYWVPEDENLYNSYFYNAHDDTSVLDKFILHGRKTYNWTDGGSAIHCNLENHLSYEQYSKLIDFAIEEGTSYFTFNIPNSKCDDCGFITKHPIDTCPKCGSKNITQYTRVIG